MDAHLLDIQGISMYFEGVRAVESVNAYVDTNEIFGIIGPNGSGKTTLINALTGVYKPSAGKVIFKGRDITGMKSYQIARLGVARTFQNLRLFRAMTVIENVMVGEHYQISTNKFDAIFRNKHFHESEEEIVRRAEEALEMVDLTSHKHEVAGSMAYGEQKRLEFARALVCEPSLLLLDEPAAGMNSVEAMDMMELIHKIRSERRIAIVLIEHNMQAMMSTADRIMVMDAGRKIAEDVPEVIQNDPKVIAVYLGE